MRFRQASQKGYPNSRCERLRIVRSLRQSKFDAFLTTSEKENSQNRPRNSERTLIIGITVVLLLQSPKRKQVTSVTDDGC